MKGKGRHIPGIRNGCRNPVVMVEGLKEASEAAGGGAEAGVWRPWERSTTHDLPKGSQGVCVLLNSG